MVEGMCPYPPLRPHTPCPLLLWLKRKYVYTYIIIRRILLWVRDKHKSLNNFRTYSVGGRIHQLSYQRINITISFINVDILRFIQLFWYVWWSIVCKTALLFQVWQFRLFLNLIVKNVRNNRLPMSRRAARILDSWAKILSVKRCWEWRW